MKTLLKIIQWLFLAFPVAFYIYVAREELYLQWENVEYALACFLTTICIGVFLCIESFFEKENNEEQFYKEFESYLESLPDP